MKSIIQDSEECYFCKSERDLQTHHCIHGTANRKYADKYGLTVKLCPRCHTLLHDRNRKMDLELIQLAQSKFEEDHTRDEFRIIFGKSWL